jgi:hypothetical protein
MGQSGRGTVTSGQQGKAIKSFSDRSSRHGGRSSGKPEIEIDIELEDKRRKKRKRKTKKTGVPETRPRLNK